MATIFASVINSGADALQNCRIALAVSAPAGLNLNYQTTDPATNSLTGAPNTPVAIPGNNGLQTSLIAFDGTEIPARPTCRCPRRSANPTRATAPVSARHPLLSH